MKTKLITRHLSLITLAAALAGCATQTHKVTATDPATNTTTTTVDKSSQSDNATLNVVGAGVKIVGDTLTAILPPLIPVIVDGLTKPVTTPAAK